MVDRHLRDIILKREAEMTEEQRNTLKSMLGHVRATLDEVEKMLVDYDQCQSEMSKKYLGAAILKTAAVFKPNVQA